MIASRLLVLSLSAAPLAAQLPTLPDYRLALLPEQIEVAIHHSTPAVHALLASLDGKTVPVAGNEVLRDPVILGIALAPKGQSKFTFDVAPAVPAALGLHVQGIAVGTNDGLPLAAGPVMATARAFGERFESIPPERLGPLGNVALRIAPDAGGQLQASFEAPSDGYALRVVAVLDRGTADVYLALKTPGPGEGMRDVVEHHEVAVTLRGSPERVRVHALHGPAPFALPTIAYGLLAKLELR